MGEIKYLELPWSMEKTIENLNELKEGLQQRVIIKNLHGRGEKDAEEIAFDFDRAIGALEKQIPQNCKRIGGTQLKCVCGAVIRLHKYCPYCGQKIDWSE